MGDEATRGITAEKLAKKPWDEFLLAMVFLLLIPLSPLILELGLTLLFHSDAERYVERTTVMITASMFAVAVGVASKSKGILAVSIFVGGLLAVAYGGMAANAKLTEAEKDNTQSVLTTPSQSEDAVKAAGEQHSSNSKFLARMAIDDLPGKVGWSGMIGMALVLLIERLRRHIVKREEFKFEWDKDS